LSEAPGLSDAQRKVASAAESIFRSDGPRTAAGRGVYEQIVREMRASPEFRKIVVAQAPQARARLLSGAGLVRPSVPGARLLGEFSLTMFDAAVERVAGTAAADAIGEITRSTLINYETARRYEFVTDLAGGESGLKKALDRLAVEDPRVPLPGTGRDYLRRVNAGAVPGGETVRAVAPFEPAIEVPFERGVNLERAGSIVLEQSGKGNAAGAAYRARAFSEAMGSYADTFPSHPGVERVTPRGQILEVMSGNEAATAKGAARVKARVASIEAGKLSEWSAGRKLSTTASFVKNGRIELPKDGLLPSAINNGERARSFFRLHSNSKVGGVLIGRKPEPGTPQSARLDLTGLRWKVTNGEIRLTLLGRDGSERLSRPFRRDLAELALAYAADGRPTAVTIIHARPLLDRRVLLHPALVDTAGGKAITRTDQIVFKLIEHEPWYVSAYLDVLNQVELYRRAWAIRQSVAGSLGLLKPEYVKEVERHLNEGAMAVRVADNPVQGERDEDRSALKFMTAETEKAGVVAALTAVVVAPEAIRDRSRSPLTVKSAYFDPQLVADLLESSGLGRSLDSFDTAMRKATLKRLGELAEWAKTREARDSALSAKLEAFKARAQKPVDDRAVYDALEAERKDLLAEYNSYAATEKANEARIDRILRRWTMPVPQLAHVSGIRERAYSPTAAECFVSEGEELGPVLDFLIQFTHDSPPYFLKGDPPAAEDKAAWEEITGFADDSPWEFPLILGRVRDLVTKALAEDPAMAEDQSAVATLAEFTILQRLFRLGLSGELGSEFPVECLAELHRDAAPSSPPSPVRTPRWDSRPGRLERGLKSFVDGELVSLAKPTTPDGLRKALEPGLKVVAALANEYAEKAADRDKSLDVLKGEAAAPSWEATWDSFQAWAVNWEDRLAKTVTELESSPVSEGEAFKERADEVVGQVRWTTSAIALRRSLDVNTDDKLARAAQGRRDTVQHASATRHGP
jgi:hypothetical protein